MKSVMKVKNSEREILLTGAEGKSDTPDKFRALSFLVQPWLYVVLLLVLVFNRMYPLVSLAPVNVEFPRWELENIRTGRRIEAFPASSESDDSYASQDPEDRELLRKLLVKIDPAFPPITHRNTGPDLAKKPKSTTKPAAPVAPVGDPRTRMPKQIPQEDTYNRLKCKAKFCPGDRVECNKWSTWYPCVIEVAYEDRTYAVHWQHKNQIAHHRHWDESAMRPATGLAREGFSMTLAQRARQRAQKEEAKPASAVTRAPRWEVHSSSEDNRHSTEGLGVLRWDNMSQNVKYLKDGQVYYWHEWKQTWEKSSIKPSTWEALEPVTREQVEKRTGEPGLRWSDESSLIDAASDAARRLLRMEVA